MGGILDMIYGWSFKLFGIKFSASNLEGTITSMCDFSERPDTLWRIADWLNTVFVPLGLSLLTLFVIIHFIKSTQEGVERITWERIVLKVAVFFILAALIKESFNLFTSIFETVNDYFLDSKTTILQGTGNGELVTSLSTNEGMNFLDTMKKNIDEADFIDSILYFIVYLILAIPFNATIIMIITQVFMRIVKLVLCVTFAPIPIAMAAEGETFRGKAISYITYTASVACEAIVIYIGLAIYMWGMGMATSVDGVINSVISLLFLNGVFAAIISFGSQFCERLFGRG